jgi:hypothetical protein
MGLTVDRLFTLFVSCASRNGDTYAGEYFADKMHGYGVYQFANGHRYEGCWHEGRKQGLGLYTFRNGDTHAGHWHHGVLETRSSQNPTPGSPTAIYHSKVLNAVQVLCKPSYLYIRFLSHPGISGRLNVTGEPPTIAVTVKDSEIPLCL